MTTSHGTQGPQDDPSTQQAREASPLRAGEPLQALRQALAATLHQLLHDQALDASAQKRIAAATLTAPPQPHLGDYSSNAALLIASLARQPPLQLAERIGQALKAELHPYIADVQVAPPGFVNLTLSSSWHLQALAGMLAANAELGRSHCTEHERIIVEFVSANPTGPMHVGHARNAAYGDALARLLAFHGHDVYREFYVNDAGAQVRKLGESIHALATGAPVPADGYQGAYVAELADQLPQASSVEPGELGRAAVELVLEQIRQSLHRFRVLPFQGWQRESELYAPQPGLHGPGEEGADLSLVQHAILTLQAAGHVYSREGALWLQTSAFGDDKDRVLIRSSGEHTYFASDIAYHLSKVQRGFQRQIDIWGADHHGYLPRIRAAYQALHYDPRQLEMLIMQLVHLVKAGERAQMSKRAGEFVTLDDLLAEIGVDAARWYLLSRSHDTTIDLDLQLARKQSAENPVYYVQYAHARIASMIRRAGPEGPARADRFVEAHLDVGSGKAQSQDVALHPSERALIKRLLEFPVQAQEAADHRAPHRIAGYALSLAQGFTAFYTDCKVLSVQPSSLEAQRIALCVATQRVLATSLDLLGIEAPQEM